MCIAFEYHSQFCTQAFIKIHLICVLLSLELFNCFINTKIKIHLICVLLSQCPRSLSQWTVIKIHLICVLLSNICHTYIKCWISRYTWYVYCFLFNCLVNTQHHLSRYTWYVYCFSLFSVIVFIDWDQDTPDMCIAFINRQVYSTVIKIKIHLICVLLF